MMKLQPNYYWSLAELIEVDATPTPYDITELTEAWQDYTQRYHLNLDDTTTTFITTYLLPCAYDIHVMITDHEQLTTADYNHWSLKFQVWLKETSERYVKLINLYHDNESKLMDRIASTTSTTAKGIDTPQDDRLIDDGDTANYLSSLGSTESTTESDAATTIGRLDEIRKGLRNFYSMWLTDFRRRFNIIIL